MFTVLGGKFKFSAHPILVSTPSFESHKRACSLERQLWRRWGRVSCFYSKWQNFDITANFSGLHAHENQSFKVSEPQIFSKNFKNLRSAAVEEVGKFEDNTLNDWIFFQKSCLDLNSKWQENSNLEGVWTSNIFKEFWKTLERRLWRRGGRVWGFYSKRQNFDITAIFQVIF